MTSSSSEPPRHLTIGDVVKSKLVRSRGGGRYGTWLERTVRNVNEDDVAIVSAPKLGSARVKWEGAFIDPQLRRGEGHGMKFYFVRHEHDTES